MTESTQHPLIPEDDDDGTELNFAALGRAAAKANETGAKTFPLPKGFTPFKHDPQAIVGTLAQLTNALHIACFKTDVEGVRTVIAGGGRNGNKFRVNAIDVDSPPLALAVRRPANTPEDDGKIAEIARMLIEAGAEVNPDPEQGHESPLVLASTAGGGKAGKAQTVKVLVDAGADLRARDRTQKMTALHWAVTCCFVNVVEVLVEAGASATSVEGRYQKRASPMICRDNLVKLAQGTLLARPPKTDDEKEAIKDELQRMLKILDDAAASRSADKASKKLAKASARASQAIHVS